MRSLLRPILILLAALAALPAAAQTALAPGDAAPAFAGINRWINSPPLTTAALRGKVVLVDFWTFECINCLHALPQVKALDAAYRDQGLVVVGVHTPELAAERDTGNLLAAVKRLGITFPVAQDNGYATWNNWHNQYWPAQYVIDRSGHVVYTHIGEGGYEAIENAVRAALAAAP
ncbi:redoxin family protein [Dyella sp.]|uniref:redoxin family protein n=1 Tax=Dyella sp. TaxID=1869338 RepID=UPI002D79B696|nr:redoxin family protein [Dyella sp.]HET6432740.1 redoxin family protein [Dyella sp.]